MNFQDTVLWIILATMILVLIIQIYYARKFRVIKNRKFEEEGIKAILIEMKSRLERQDRKILDQQVKIDILETKFKMSKSESELKSVSEGINMIQEKTMPVISQQVDVKSQSHVFTKELDPTSRHIIELLNSGPKTPRWIMQNVGKSREHTARLMKKLFDEGILDRDESKKPFTYVIRRKH